MTIGGMIGAMVLPNVGGWLGAFTTAGQIRKPDGKAWYENLKKPSLNPPNWVFGPAWTALYTGMGYASYKVWEDCGGFTDEAVLPLALYGAQLAINWTWSPVFFKYHKLGLAVAHILCLDAAAVTCTYYFHQASPNTIFFMAPYLAWLSFASYLNFSIWQLNKKDDKINK